MLSKIFVFVALMAIAAAMPKKNVNTLEENSSAVEELDKSVELVNVTEPEPIETTFKCDGRIYGYYADLDNDCEVFHVCYSYNTLEGDRTIRYSFRCPKYTVFDQRSLVCNTQELALPCSVAESFYHINLKLQPVSTTELPFVNETTTVIF